MDPWTSAYTLAPPLGPSVSQPGDRRHGQQWPLWQNLQQLGYYRQQSRILCRTNSQAAGLLKNFTNYLIGPGFKYTAAPKPGAADADGAAPGDQPGGRTQKLVDMVQAVIDRFTGEADPYSRVTPWGRREREAFRRVPRDGEVFLRLTRLKAGDGLSHIEVRFIEPEQIADYGTVDAGWSFGIQHFKQGKEEDVERVLRYWAVYSADPTDGEEIDAADIIHIKNPDEDSTVKRGLPLFYGDTYAAFDRAAKLQRNLSEGAALQAAIAWIEQFDAASRAQVQAYQDAQTDFRRPSPYSDTGREDAFTHYPPGSVPKIGKGKQFVQPPYNAGAGSQQAVVQGDLRQGLAAACAPEFFSGDASNNNYASIQMAGSPVIKAAVADQAYYASHFARAVWAAVLWAVECGELPREALAAVKLTVEPPQVLHSDPLQQAQTDQIYVTLGAKDPDTVSAELGLDPRQVVAGLVRRQQELGPQLPGLDVPGDTTDADPPTDPAAR